MVVMIVRVKPNPLLKPGILLSLGNGTSCIVDPGMYAFLSQWKWYPLKSFSKTYAARTQRINGKVHIFRMHRVVAHTPDGMIPHHLNEDSLDNRRENLLNMSKFDHEKMYSWR